MRYWNNKLGKYNALKTDSTLAQFLPPTAVATKPAIHRMLEAYGSVYLKPSQGTAGFGIFKLSRTDHGYRLRHGSRSRTFKHYDASYDAFAKAARKKTYLVQKSIPLLRYKGRPFDLRIMVQKNSRQKWEATGIVGRLARPRKIVTNYHSGGKPMPAHELLAPFISKSEQSSYVNRLESISLRISTHLHKFFPRFRAYGVDMGIDSKQAPWIIEVNSRPDKSIFNALSDKRMYRKIMRYARIAKR